MRFRKNRDNEVATGDLTPMIDMTFQLIAFFMVLINFTKNEQNQEIQLPDSVLAKPPEDQMKDTITLHLKKDGMVVFHGRTVSLDGLGPQLVRTADGLRGQKKDVAQATVIIRGHKQAPAGKVQELIQLCQDHRFEKFALRAKQDVTK